MTPRDLAYWLHGFFQLNDQVTTLTPAQAATIKRYLATTAAASNGNTEFGAEFCQWLGGVLDGLDDGANGLAAKPTGMIRIKLDALFDNGRPRPAPPPRASDDNGLRKVLC